MKDFWIREYICHNPECCDGQFTIRVTHSKDTKTHYCTWCGEKCEYVDDIET